MPELLSFVSADGTVTDLKALPGVRALGDVGLEMPAFTLVEEEVPGQAGARLREVKTLARDVTVPFLLEQPDEAALRGLLRLLARRMNPTRGDGRLRHTAADGSVRDLICRYAEGLGGSRIVGDAGQTWRRAALVFRALDPYWHDAADRVETFTRGTVATFFPFFPLRLTSSEVFASATVDNTGDVESWPVWQVTGPGGPRIVLRNLTTRHLLTVETTLAAGNVLTIDTRPGFKTVRLGDGSNLFPLLTAASSLWPLAGGLNSVQVEMAGATADSSVVLSYKHRYLGV
jgi:phage-related protein